MPTNRNAFIKQARRVVIKAGSGMLTGNGGLNTRVINNLSGDICGLMERGVEVVLVSSGAIASGLKKLGMTKRPKSISKKQATAAVGQSSLIMAYEKAFARCGKTVAQILITRDDFNNRNRYLNARNTIFTLLEWGVTPVINENDTVAFEEIKFGDNDNLSAMVANMTEANLLINLTDMDGLFDKDPRKNKDAVLIRVVEKLNSDVIRCAGADAGTLGTGGMASKVAAARKVALRGIPAIIANGTRRGVLQDIFSGKDIGTLFLPHEKAFCGRKHWIAFSKAPKGRLVIDGGAADALRRNGKSLLPSGVREATGDFVRGDSVIILDKDGVELAVGMTNYSSEEVKKIMGLKSSEIESVLGYKDDDEVIHRDNMAITDGITDGE
ncbi:MAG: glutamate 5-kinase [Deltaproteobacteria bacterium]|nr:glutamate 5-kinase [Deltaproteobacteria bacterium]